MSDQLNKKYLETHAMGKRKENIVKAVNMLNMIHMNERDDFKLCINIEKLVHLLRNRREELNK